MPNVLRVGVAAKARAITPSDSVDFPEGAAGGGIYVGGAGNVSMVFGSTVVTFTAVPAGTRLPFAPTRINASLTTATLIVAGW